MTKPKEPKRRRGRPAYEPTDQDRGKVVAFSIAGYTEVQISGHLKIDPKTLRKHYAYEIDYASMDNIGATVGSLVRAARGAKAEFDKAGNCVRVETKPEAWAVCFLLKTKAKDLGFTERNEHTGKDGKDLFEKANFSKLSDTRFALLKDILREAGVALED